MRQKLEKYRNIGMNPLFIVGCGFIIVLFIAVYMLTYESGMSLTIEELKERKLVVDNESVYEFMNETFFRSDSVIIDSLEFQKIMCFSLGHSKDVKNFIKQINDTVLSKTGKRYMLNQLNKKSLLWNENELKNCWSLAPADFQDLTNNSCWDYWEAFQKKFGNGGKHNYSVPIFNSSKTFVVIEHSGQGGCLLGSGEVLSFIKVNGKWKFYKELHLWIS